MLQRFKNYFTKKKPSVHNGNKFNSALSLKTIVSPNLSPNLSSESTNSVNYDLSQFLKKETIIVSDLEGTAPTSQLDEIMKGDKQVLYLGDLCDYTYYEQEISKNLKTENLCMLRLMKHFVDKQHSEHGATRWILGNRDLNKIKLRHLLQVRDKSLTYWKEPEELYSTVTKKSAPQHTQHIKKTNLHLVNISKLAIELIDLNKTPNIWAINNNDFKKFAPFWNINNPNYTKWRYKSKDLSSNTLHERFLLIFGRDPNEGTMSAGNTLNKLPEEYGFSMDKLKNTAELNKVDLNELLSALVFIIYMRMLDKDLYRKIDTNDKAGQYDGYLYKYLVNGSCANYAYSNNDLYLFSHAGLTMDFFKNNNSNTPEAFKILSELSEKEWTNIKSPYSNHKGGGVNKTVEDIIQKFNETVSKKIKYILDKDSNLHGDIIYYLIQGLLAISTPSYQNSKLTKLKHLSPVCLLPKDSPIKEDLRSLNNLGSVVNVFGHTTKGFGYTFSKIYGITFSVPFNNKNEGTKTAIVHPVPFSSSENAANITFSVPLNNAAYVSETNSYVITTDFSNGIMKSDLLNQSQYNNNNLLLTMKLGTEQPFHLNGSLIFSDKLAKSSNVSFNEVSNPETIKKLNNSTFISNIDSINNVKKLNYNYRFNLDNFMYDPECLFNGIGSINTALTLNYNNNNNNEFSTPNNKMNIYSLLKSDQHKLLILESITQYAGTRKTRKHRKVRTIRRNRK
jgi:hypothetical protein